MGTLKYFALILLFTPLFIACEKDSDTQQNNTITYTYKVSMLVVYPANLRDGSYVKFIDQDGKEKTVTFEKGKPKGAWKKEFQVKSKAEVSLDGVLELKNGEIVEKIGREVIVTRISDNLKVLNNSSFSSKSFTVPLDKSYPIAVTKKVLD